MPVKFEVEIDADLKQDAEREIEEIIDGITPSLKSIYHDEEICCSRDPAISSTTDGWLVTLIYSRKKKVNYDAQDIGLARNVREVLGSPWEHNLTLREVQADKSPTKYTYNRAGLQSGSAYSSIRWATCELQPDGSCFIATAACGSANELEVVTLRAFRDQILCHYRIGQLFIRGYEAVSPRLAQPLSRHAAWCALTRVLLIYPLAKIIRFLIR